MTHASDRRLKAFYLLAFCGILFLGTALRIRNLGRPSFIEDELFHVHGAKSLLSDGTTTLPGGYVYTRALPLTHLISWTYRLLGADEFSSRLWSVLFGMAAVWLTYLIAGRLVNRPVAVLAAALAAVSPFSIVLSRYTRMYTLHQCLYLLVVYIFFRVFEPDGGRPPLAVADDRARRRRLLWQGAGLALWGAVYFADVKTHSLTVFFLPGVYLYFLLQTALAVPVRGWAGAIRSRHGICLGLMTAAGLAGMAVPSVRAEVIGSFLWLPEWSKSTADEPLYYYWFITEQYPFLWLMAAAGALFLAARVLSPALYLVAGFLGPVAVLSAFPLKSERYIFHLMPIFDILVACGLFYSVSLLARWVSAVPFGRRPPAQKLVPAAGVLSVILGAGVIAAGPTFALARRIGDMDSGTVAGIRLSPWREVGEMINPRRRPGDLIIASRTSPVSYYCGRADYSLNRMAEVELRTFNLRDKEGRLLDYTTGAPYLETRRDLVRAVERGPGAWLVIEKSLLDPAKGRMSQDEINYVNTRFRTVGITSDRLILVMRHEPVKRDAVSRTAVAPGARAGVRGAQATSLK